MHSKGAVWAAALSLTMALSPLTPMTRAFASEAADGSVEVSTNGEAAGENTGSDEGTGELPEGDVVMPWIDLGDEPDEQPDTDEQPGTDGQPGTDQPSDEQPGTEQPAAEGLPAWVRTLNVTTGKSYADFAEAMKAANDGDTIQVIKDQNLIGSISVNKSITIDLNGHTLSGAAYGGAGERSMGVLAVMPGAHVTIDDSSEGQCGCLQNTTTSGYCIWVEGSLTFKAGKVEAKGVCGKGIVHGGEELVIEGGTIYGHEVAVYRNNYTTKLPAHIVINGGIIRSDSKSIGNLTTKACEDGHFELNGGSYSDNIGNGGYYVKPAGKQLSRGEGEEYYTLKSYRETIDFSTITFDASLVLTDNFDINVNVSGLPAQTKPEDFRVRYWFGEDEASAAEAQLSGTDDNHFKVATCSAMQMCDKAHVLVYYKSGPEPVRSLDCSVHDYCLNAARDGSQTKEFRMLCLSILKYGSAAQNYFKYETDAMAGEGIENVALNVSSVPKSFAAQSKGTTAYASKTTVSLTLDSQVAINFWITPKEGVKGSEIPIEVDGKLVEDGRARTEWNTGARITRQTLDDGRVHVQISNIAPQYMDHAYELCVGAWPMKADNVPEQAKTTTTKTVKYSVLSYAYAKQNLEASHDICLALYNYYYTVTELFG